MKRYLSVTFWDPVAKKAKLRTPNAPALNAYLDQVYADLLECQKQLLSEFKLITAQAIKARYLGEDDDQKTLLDLIDYHNTNMRTVLKFGTLMDRAVKVSHLGRIKVSSVNELLKVDSFVV